MRDLDETEPADPKDVDRGAVPLERLIEAERRAGTRPAKSLRDAKE